MKTLLALLIVLGALVVGSIAGFGGTSGFRGSYIPHFGPNPKQGTIKAASDAGCGTITCAAYEAGINGYVQDVAADSGKTTNVYDVATEYYDTSGVGPTGVGPTGVGPTGATDPGAIAYDDSFGGTYEDTQHFPASACPHAAGMHCLTESQLVTEIQNVMATKGWTASGNNLFAIMLPDNTDTCDNSGFYCASNIFCAYHDWLGDGPDTLIFAVEPFSASFGCDASGEPTNPQGFPNSPEVDETVNTLSHETNEAVTDPYGTGWWSNHGNENGDMCAWWFGAPLGTVGGQPYNQTINGNHYSLQQEWSNSADSGNGGCLQEVGGAVSSSSPYVGDNGPLNYHDGPVMRNVNVYTIYWIPGPTPALTTAPVIKGTPAVAQKVTTTNGVWTNSPTSYKYKWQRCDSTGNTCIPIGGATSSTYTLLSGDAGHYIRSMVEAINANGPSAQGFQPSAEIYVLGIPQVVTLPVISGTPQVGSKLTVSKGVWTYSPTKFTYKWLRCAAAGDACKVINNATHAGYTLTSADAGHTMRAKVTASNAAGRRTATTAATNVVTS